MKIPRCGNTLPGSWEPGFRTTRRVRRRLVWFEVARQDIDIETLFRRALKPPFSCQQLMEEGGFNPILDALKNEKDLEVRSKLLYCVSGELKSGITIADSSQRLLSPYFWLI